MGDASRDPSDVVLFVDREGRIIDANPAALAAYGYDRAELLKLTWDDVRSGGGAVPRTSAGAQQHFEERHRHRNGSTFPVEVTCTGTLAQGDAVLLCIVRNVSARTRVEATHQLLHETDARILKGDAPSSVLDFVAGEIAERFGFRLVQISLRGGDGSMQIRSHAGPASEFVADITVRWDESPTGRGPTGRAVRTGQPALVNVAGDPEFAPWRERALTFGLRSGLALPLRAKSETLGALTIYDAGEAAFDQETVARLTAFADQVTLSLVAAQDQALIRLQTVALESAANAVVVTDRDGVIRWVNPAFSRLSGYDPQEVVGRRPSLLKSGVHGPVFYREMWATLLAGRVWQGELYNRRKDGSVYPEEQTITPVRDADGHISHFIAVKQDVGERKLQEDRIRHLALHDSLTDLPNRRALGEALTRVTARARRGLRGALLLADLDHFKLVSNTFGHAVGERVLKQVARLLQRRLAPGDFLARLGGDDFALLAEDVTPERARALAEDLRRTIDEALFEVEAQRVSLSLSVGVAFIDGRLDADGVMCLADAALYAAREKGGNRVVASSEPGELRERLTDARHWASRIKQALHDRRFVLHYQPVVRLSDGVTEHVEVLLRMRGDGGDGDLILPGRFLDAAERFGLTPQIDRWVLEETLSTLARRADVKAFVNLSGLSLSDASHLGHIEGRVAEARLDPGRLVFEITETAAVADLATTQRWIVRLKELGCQFALDDFGTGFSSFDYLRALPADYVKIDGSFVRTLDRDRTSRALVQAIKSVAQALGKEVIAEAVETRAVAALLRELDVEHGQGYYLAPPSPELPPNGHAHPGLPRP